ncbi:MAG: hypothetical protein ACF8TS_05815 [Maioricimonas sp. JB049]
MTTDTTGSDSVLVGRYDRLDALDTDVDGGVVAPDDPLALHLLRLVSLYPDAVRFRMRDLEAMDDATKRQLIADINTAVGIRPADG